MTKRTAPLLLVVEDEAVLRRLLVMTLRAEGFTVIEAVDGAEGITLACKRRPNLILLDIIMPEVNGMEMLQRLRKDPWGKKADVILLTNLGDDESIKRAKDFGVTDYFIKSDWPLDELAHEIKAKLKTKDAQQLEEMPL